METRLIENPADSFIKPAAKILVESFTELSPGTWPTLEFAIKEVQECLEPGRIVIAAYQENNLLGWIGARPIYNLTGWELHPAAVNKSCQFKGTGTTLIKRLEKEVKSRGGITLFLGTDDAEGWTSLAGKDLYLNLWQEIASIKNLNRHPYEFYMKNGYSIVGVIPDANGIGRPDILMAKRL